MDINRQRIKSDDVGCFYFHSGGRVDFIHFEKVSKRKEVDISAVNSAIALQISDGMIKKASIACGGVGPTTLYMPKTSHYLEGKPMTEDTFVEAYDIIGERHHPLEMYEGVQITGSCMENLLMKHYLAYESSQEADGHEE